MSDSDIRRDSFSMDAADVPARISSPRKTCRGLQNASLPAKGKEAALQPEKVLHCAPVFIALLKGGTIIWVNGRSSELFGYADDDLLGRSMRMLFAPEEEFMRVEREVYGALMDKDLTEVIAECITRDGRPVEVLVRASAINIQDPPDVVVVLSDISQLRRAEVDFKESEERFRAFFDLATDGIILIDPLHPDGPVITDANSAACSMNGYDRDEMLGRPKTLLEAHTDREMTTNIAHELMSGRPLTYEVTHIRKDGTTFPVEVSARLVHIGGRPYILAIDRDITERKRIEGEELKTRKLESIGILAGGIAHDFNNLLQAIMGNISLAMMVTSPGDRVHEWLSDGRSVIWQRSSAIVS